MGCPITKYNLLELIYKTQNTRRRSLQKQLTNGNYQVQTQVTGSPLVIKVFDLLDREIQTKTQGLNNKWVVTQTEYDMFGKKIKGFEPYFEGESPIKFTTTSYDELDRPVSIAHHSGKTITTCYNGLTVTVDDGTKKTTKTLDALGNTIYHKDPGGEITYTYFANGNLKEANYEGIKIQIEQDGWGNKTKLTDTSAGVYTYTYDDWGRTLTETTPKGSTSYTYDQYGKTLSETTKGDQTDISLSYAYDANSLLPTKIIGKSNGKIHSYETLYDANYRIAGKKETTPDYTYSTAIGYDSQNKVSNNTASFKPSHLRKTITTATQNIYDANGLQYALKDTKANKTIWELKTENAKGQSLQTTLGNGMTINNSYDAVGFPVSIKHAGANQTAIDMVYAFDTKRGILLSREFKHLGKKETFTHDQLDRLVEETLNNAIKNAYTYDHKGRMTYNSALGKYGYTDSNFRLDNLTLNQQANKSNLAPNYKLSFNSFKAPTEIYLPRVPFWKPGDKAKGDRISFEYNPLKERSKIIYGSIFPMLRNQTKVYTADKAFEMKRETNLISPDTEVVAYIDGDPYTASYIQKTSFKNRISAPKEENLYLHRDYQQTILAITTDQGKLVEQRRFDAWGNIEEVRHYNKRFFFFKTYTTNKELETLDRGYTGHEHLQSVGLIHMNGRIYDPLLRRFLGPDNFVQDPFNTQNFNRYGYVMNNPLLYTDPSGEFFGLVLFAIYALAPTVAIGAAISVTINAIMNIVNGNTNFMQGAGKAALFGGLGGVIAPFIGEIATSIGGAGGILFQAGAHGITGGMMNVINGQDFGAGFAAGAMASLVGSALGKVKGLTEMGEKGKQIFTPLGRAAVIASGGLSGGISSTIAGGNFWDGARQGLITAGLNHAMHEIFPLNDPGDPKTKKTNIPKPSTTDKLGDVLDGFELSNEVKLAIMSLGKGDFSDFTKNYFKTFEIIGKGAGFLSAGVSWYEYSNQPTTANLIEAMVNTGATGFGPVTSMTFGALSVSGATDNFYQFLGTQVNNACNCNAGYNVYNSARGVINNIVK